MSDYSTRNIIDYAMDDNGIKFREALYASIHDKVSAHIEDKMKELSKNIVNEPEEEVNAEESE
jgi:hypothetical protein